MGNKGSKTKPREELQCKDWKFVEKHHPAKVKLLDTWITKFGFNGQLNSQKIVELQDKIKQKTKNNLKKMKKMRCDDT